MRWSVEFLDVARRQFLDLPQRIRFQVAKKIALLEGNPFPASSKKLRHREDLYRVRAGDYRVLYRVDLSNRRVEIFRVRHRADAYRGL